MLSRPEHLAADKRCLMTFVLASSPRRRLKGSSYVASGSKTTLGGAASLDGADRPCCFVAALVAALALAIWSRSAAEDRTPRREAGPLGCSVGRKGETVSLRVATGVGGWSRV